MEAIIINLFAAVLIIILFPFAMEIYKESKKVKNEYYKKKRDFDNSQN